MSIILIDTNWGQLENSSKGTISTSPTDPSKRVRVNGIPVERIVDIFDVTEVPFIHHRRTISAKDGQFKVDGIDPSRTYDIIARDPNRRDTITPRVTIVD